MKHLDLTYIKSNVTDDESFLRELLEVFKSSLTPDMEDFKTALSDEDHMAVKRAAHKLKSSFRSLGMKDLAILMQDIEDMGRLEKPMDEIRADADKLHQEVPVLLGDVEEYLERN